MPRFYFDLFAGAEFRDTEGVMLPDVQAARGAAVRSLSQMLGPEAERFWEGEPWSMVVRDEHGGRVLKLVFRVE